MILFTAILYIMVMLCNVMAIIIMIPERIIVSMIFRGSPTPSYLQGALGILRRISMLECHSFLGPRSASCHPKSLRGST